MEYTQKRYRQAWYSIGEALDALREVSQNLSGQACLAYEGTAEDGEVAALDAGADAAEAAVDALVNAQYYVVDLGEQIERLAEMDLI